MEKTYFFSNVEKLSFFLIIINIYFAYQYNINITSTFSWYIDVKLIKLNTNLIAIQNI